MKIAIGYPAWKHDSFPAWIKPAPDWALAVPPLGLEGYLGQAAADEAGAAAVITEALQQGVRYFDTAPGYGDGRSEQLLGQSLPQHGVIVASKCTLDQAVDAEHLEQALSQTLRHLQREQIDVYQLHGLHWTTDNVHPILDRALPLLQKEQARGRIRSIGITAEHSNGALEQLIQSRAFDVLQICYNVCFQGACDYQREPLGIIPLAKQLGMSVVSMRSTTSGVLQHFLRSMNTTINDDDITRASIQFNLSTPEIDVVLVGMRTADEVRNNAKLAAQNSSRFSLTDIHNRYPGHAS